MTDESQSDETRSSLALDTEGDRTLSPDHLEIDHVYEALGHPRRRYLCYTLLEDAEWSLPGLATKIAAWEDGVSTDAVTDARRDQVYVSLYHATSRNSSIKESSASTRSRRRSRPPTTPSRC
ncbi:DUF7344 domain-containing protein [Saliphagus infecundisoli]|uniref:DUF7344 domain-containing protein n=1 Tax=Saliphagus infecundisoli TaxID=1849069 RepID=A0ABD5QE93_9EURY|nr:hypothetical protein [Saliphagus infecundisoli]